MAAMLVGSLGIVRGSILHVPQDYPTIYLATTLALEQDTILLDHGEYSETVVIPAMGLVYAGPFLISGDTADIATCTWKGVMNGDDSLRCLETIGTGGNLPNTSFIGIRFVGITHSLDYGGAILAQHQSIEIEHCAFDSCAAGFGGAIGVIEGSASLTDCRFNNCGHFSAAAILYLRGAQVEVRESYVMNSRSYEELDEIPQQFTVHSGNLELRRCTLTQLGFNHYPGGTTVVSVGKPPDSIAIVDCNIFQNQITRLVRYGGFQIDFLRVDSNHFHDNALRTSLYSQDSSDSLTKFQAVGNIFERFSPIEGYLMHGLFALDTSTRHETRIERNFISDIHGGHTSFCSIWGDNPDLRIVRGNYVENCSNSSFTWPPSGQVLTLGTGDGELEQNIFGGNEGYAVFQGNLEMTSYARHNYWNSASGPYDSIGNRGGQGDTVEWRVIYQPWAMDTSFMSATPEPREPAEVPNSFIGTTYPNPFNGQVTIEFVVRMDQEISLDVYDLTGRHVATVFDGRMRKGVHIRNWNPESQASGIYFARLVGADGARSTTKLMYLK